VTVPFPPPGPGEDEPSREELLQRERQRRLALLEQRKRRQQRASAAGSPTPPAPAVPAQPPPGFASPQQWQEALEAARAVAEAAGQAAAPLETAMRSMTASELAAAVVGAVAALPAVQAVSLLWRCQEAGLEVLPAHQAARARALLERAPASLPEEQEAPVDPEAEKAWQIYADYERIRHVKLGVERQRQLLGSLPLPVVDDLIDAGRISAEAVPEDGEHHLYLLARLAPGRLDREELVALGWEEALLRREFYARLARGDVQVLEQAEALTGKQRRLAAALQAVRRTGDVPVKLVRYEWLWPALERLAPTATLNRPEHKPYARWLLLRRTFWAIREAHRARLHGDEHRYRLMLQTAWDNAASLQGSRSIVGWEARNALAYLMVVRAGHNPHYDDALDVLAPAPGQALEEDELPQEARLRLATNREILRTLKEQRKGFPMLNPYAVLGVPDGHPQWKERWRQLRRSLDADGQAHANAAKDAIQALERGRAALAPFTFPLMPEKWANPQPDERELAEGLAPLPRRTRPATPAEVELPRERAAQGIVRAACGHVRTRTGAPEQTVTDKSHLSEGGQQ